MYLFDSNIASAGLAASWMPSAEFRLRPYQDETLDTIQGLYLRGVRRHLVVMATGLGKTQTFCFLPTRFPDLAAHGVLVMVHRKELVEQAANRMRQIWPLKTVAVEMAGERAWNGADVVVSSVQTLGRQGSNRIKKFSNRFGIIIVDEAHHITPGSQYQAVLDFFGVGPGEQITLPDGRPRLSIGVTATPNRHDGAGLHQFYDEVPVNFDILWGIRNGYLVDIKALRVDTNTDISAAKTRAGDFAQGDLSKLVNTHLRNEVAVKAWLEHGGRQGLAFCVDINHAISMAQVFQAFGIEAHAIHSGNRQHKMSREDRSELVEAFRSGDFPVLINVGIATEGFDCPTCDTILMCRPTKSTPLFTQMIGRGTRPAVNPTAPTAEGRREQIMQSSKPFMRLVELTDNTGRHNIVTLPALFGLDADFDTKQVPISVILDKVEAEEATHPEKPVRMAKSLDEVDIIANQISVWEVADTPEDLKGITSHTWMQLSEGVYQIHVPASKSQQGAGGLLTRDFTIRLERDRLGIYEARLRVPAHWKGGQYYPEYVRTSDLEFNSKQEAVQYYDRWISGHYHDITGMIEHERAWRSKPATDKQRQLLKRLKVFIPEQYDLTRGKASRLINAAKAAESISAKAT